jgi:probable phosphoglycerate mutase
VSNDAAAFVPTRVVLVRHGESNATVGRMIGGYRSCNGLSELGRQQAERLAGRLAETGEIEATVLLSSQFARAIETAEVIGRVWDLEAVVDPAFGEHDPGPDCDGLSFSEFIERFGMPDWETDPHDVLFPGGETVAEFHHRATSGFARAVRENVGATIVIVCHGGVVNAVLRHVLRVQMSGLFDLYTTNTSLTEVVLERPGRWRLDRYNDAAHLAGLPSATERSD